MLSDSSTEYTLPGVLHYLQVEWRRFDRERNEWAIERSELKAHIALLEGERRGMENTKMDLMKRVKMLEYALRQERKRYLSPAKQKALETSDVDSPNIPSSPIIRNVDILQPKIIPAAPLPNNKKGATLSSKARDRSRQILASCLDEINYLTSMPTKFPLMHSIVSHTHTTGSQDAADLRRDFNPSPQNQAVAQQTHSSSRTNATPPNLSSSPSLSSRPASNKGTNRDSRLVGKSARGGAETIRGLNPTAIQQRPDPFTSSNKNQAGSVQSIRSVDTASPPPSLGDRNDEGLAVPTKVDEVVTLSNNGNPRRSNGIINSDDDVNTEETDADTDDTSMDENDLLSKEVQERYNLSEEKVHRIFKVSRKDTSHRELSPDPQDDANFSLKGSLDPSEIESIQNDAQKQQQPTMWKPRVTIKGHLDSVRSVAFHPTGMMVASGSDDGTVKIWNLKRSIGSDGDFPRKAAHEEADPTITYRGHTQCVTGVAISAEQNRVYSSSLDTTIRVWRLPPEGHSLFAPVDPSLNITTYVGHTDAIWDFKLFPIARDHSCLLGSASADGTVKLWDTQTSGQLLKSTLTFDGVNAEGDSQRDKTLPAPTSLDFCHTDLNKIAVSYANAQIRIFDMETGQVVMTLEGSNNNYDGTLATQINKIVAHPTMSLIVSGHEDRQIKFLDLKSGKCAFSMPAHLDAVSALDIDPSGVTLVSGGHDSSIRLWDITMSKTCIQEFSAHRRKGHEGVLSVQYHKTFPWMVSGGADSIMKVYHHTHQ